MPEAAWEALTLSLGLALGEPGKRGWRGMEKEQFTNKCQKMKKKSTRRWVKEKTHKFKLHSAFRIFRYRKPPFIHTVLHHIRGFILEGPGDGSNGQ